MYRILQVAIMVLVGSVAAFTARTTAAVSVTYAGTHYDIGGTFFPGYTFPQVSIVPWRTNSGGNTFSTGNSSPDLYYGTAGWALFGTSFEFPNANTTNYNVDYLLVEDPQLPNVQELPSFVSGSQILAHHKGGADHSALIDDPARQAGIRWWTFDGTNYPPPDGTNTTGAVPYLKVGYLHGWDEYGNDPSFGPAARWGFTVGADVPPRFRVGVMTDGLALQQRAPGEVLLVATTRQFPDFSGEGTLGTFLDAATTGTIPYDEPGSPITPGTNRFIDMHFFDVIGAQPGDSFFIAAQAYVGQVYAGINGISFDILPSADFNGDEQVDAADYVVWRRTDGSPQGYNIWRPQFGQSVGSGSFASTTVPEPGGFMLLAIASWCLPRRRHSRSVAGDESVSRSSDICRTAPSNTFLKPCSR